ncbi:MAG: hypothetical protein IPM36_04105 [Lewinellaceae bacterium]|nr:hypothetical protein [Lewinellaceae bacterium]
MNQFIANQTKARVVRLLGGAALSMLFMLLASVSSWGQESQVPVGTVPPAFNDLAGKMGVTPYAFNKWNDATALTKINSEINLLQPMIADGTASPAQLLKYAYYSNIAADITKYSIGLEYSMLTQLSRTHKEIKSTLPQAQLTAVYNGLVNIL